MMQQSKPAAKQAFEVSKQTEHAEQSGQDDRAFDQIRHAVCADRMQGEYQGVPLAYATQYGEQGSKDIRVIDI